MNFSSQVEMNAKKVFKYTQLFLPMSLYIWNIYMFGCGFAKTFSVCLVIVALSDTP